MLPDLQEDYEDDPDAKKEKSFPLWLVEVERVDIKRSRANARLRTIADEQRKAADVAAAGKRNANSDSNDRPPKKTRNENVPPASSSNADTKRCPKLTAEEQQLLNANHGCRKCRVLFVAHATDPAASKTCPFPSADNYKPITAASVTAAAAALTADQRKQFGLAPAKGTAVAALKNAAAVMPDIEDDNDSSDESLSF